MLKGHVPRFTSVEMHRDAIRVRIRASGGKKRNLHFCDRDRTRPRVIAE